MPRRIFDPNTGSGDSILVASFDGTIKDAQTVEDIEREREMIENDKRERDFRSLMSQRHSFAG